MIRNFTNLFSNTPQPLSKFGKFAIFVFTPFSDLCKELEAIGVSGRLDGAAELVVQAEAEYERVKAALEAVRSNKYDWSQL